MSDKFDNYLREELKNQAEPVSEEHYSKVDNVLNNLPVCKCKMINTCKVAVVVLACLVVSAIGICVGISSLKKDKN